MSFWTSSLTVGTEEIRVIWGDEPADHMADAIYELIEAVPDVTVNDTIESFHRAYFGESHNLEIDRITNRALNNIHDAFQDTDDPLTMDNLTYGVRFATFSNDSDTKLSEATLLI